MNFDIFESVHDGKVFRIEEDSPEVGAYLYVFESNHCIADYLQINIEECKAFAFEEFGISIESWEKVT